MFRNLIFPGIVAFATGTLLASEFPLELKKMTYQEALSCPGSSGRFSQLLTTKPASIKEPKAISSRPLYGRLAYGGGQMGMTIRLDESQGDGKGYDQLILDLNRNEDLTDDPEIKRVNEMAQSQAVGGTDHPIFGPIEAEAINGPGPWRPSLYAETYFYNRELFNMPSVNFLGYMVIRPGNYLQAEVELGVVKQTIGIIDGDCNLYLGDSLVLAKRKYSGQGEFLMGGGSDNFLRDHNGSGRFESDMFSSEAEPFGDIIYFGGSPYSVALAKDLTSLKIEPYSEPLGELILQPNSKQLRTIALAKETGSDEFTLLNMGVENGKIKAPAGTYYLYSCLVGDTAANGDQVLLSGYMRPIGRPIKVEPDQTTTLNCGPPLELRISASKRQAPGAAMGGGLLGAVASLFSGGGSANKNVLEIGLTVVGAGGETYSGFTKSKDGKVQAPPPKFIITDTEGAQVGAGNLEYG